jgi:heme A synthase
MYAILGSVLTAGGLLAVVALMLLFRHPGAPRWTRSELAASLLGVAVTALIGVGVGYLALTPREFLSQGASATDLTVMAVSLAAVLVVGRALRGRVRALDLAADTGATVTVLTPGGTVSSDEPTPPRTPRPHPGRPPRKAA